MRHLLAAVAIAIAIVAVLTLCGCGAACPREQALVDSISNLVEAAEDEEARAAAEERLRAAQAALEACEHEAEGEWCRHLMDLTAKVIADLIRGAAR